MVLTGTIVNGLLIVLGTIIGRFLHRIPERMKGTVLSAIGLVVMVLGIQMALETQNILIVIISLVVGAVIGEWIELDGKLNQLGQWIEKKTGTKAKKKENDLSISQGFVTATLIFVIGAMAIIGALDSGIRGDHQVLYTKSIIDGFTSIILASTLGIGVVFSAIPVVLYQGAIALFATQIDRIVPPELMDHFIIEMTGTGGVMIAALGLNLMGVTTIRVANLLPGIVVVGVIVTGMYWYQLIF